MVAKHHTEKVVCYVTHQDRLLVFTHLDVPLTVAGVQVPAGTIEPGETPRQAALREVREETGLTDLIVEDVLATDHLDVPPVRTGSWSERPRQGDWSSKNRKQRKDRPSSVGSSSAGVSGEGGGSVMLRICSPAPMNELTTSCRGRCQ